MGVRLKVSLVTPLSVSGLSALQVEHILMEGAKAAGSIISAIADSISSKSVTARRC